MFSLMPYENSLVVMEMNGPQLKAVLERAYRNYYYYKYVPGYGGYSYYTTCMLDTDKGNQIIYRDDLPRRCPAATTSSALLDRRQPVDFTDADTYYRVSTVNYLAAGSCNFNDAGRDPVAARPDRRRHAVLRARRGDRVHAGPDRPISPAIEGRIAFPPVPRW